jgi:membrane protein YdbS with pleckstrin-like domain
VGDPPRQHPGLSRSGAGDDRDEQRWCLDRGALVGVEVGEQRFGVHVSTLRSDGDNVCAMPYPRELLNDDETIAVDLHPHWWFFAWPTAVLIAGVILAILSVAWDSDVTRTTAIVMLLVGAVWLGVRYMKWLTTNFVVTTDRVIYRSGLITKSGIEIPLDRVNTVFFNQGIFERMVGTGDLMIESAGTNGEQHFTDIHDPDRVQNTIHRQIELKKGGRGGAATTGTADVAGQLEKFEGMLERGTISQEEFDAQKQRLLGS